MKNSYMGISIPFNIFLRYSVQFIFMLQMCLFWCQELLFSLFLLYCLKTLKQPSSQITHTHIYTYTCTHIFLCRKTLLTERKKTFLNKSPFNHLQECYTNYFPTGWPFHLLMAFWNKIALTRWECYVCHISNSIFSLVGTE